MQAFEQATSLLKLYDPIKKFFSINPRQTEKSRLFESFLGPRNLLLYSAHGTFLVTVAVIHATRPFFERSQEDWLSTREELVRYVDPRLVEIVRIIVWGPEENREACSVPGRRTASSQRSRDQAIQECCLCQEAARVVLTVGALQLLCAPVVGRLPFSFRVGLSAALIFYT